MGRGRTVAFVFVDLVRSTDLMHRLGTQVNDALSEQYLACLRSVGASHDGQEVRSLGDGLVLAFPGALGDAVACAGELHRSIRRLGRDGDHGDLELRIGLSVGEATRLPDGSWSGAAVVEAARLVELARPGTTLAPDVARRLLGPGSDVRTTSVGERDLQGFPDPLACCEIVWDPDPDEVAWEQRQLRRRVRRAAADWDSRARDPADLYRGARLAATLEVLDPTTLVGADRAFLEASVDQQRDLERQSRREVRRLRRSLAGVGIALVLALVAAGVAVAQRREADRSASRAAAEARAATVARLVAESQVQLTHDRYLSALLAVEADQRAHDASTRSALLSTVLEEPRRLASLATGPAFGVWPLAGGDQVLILTSRGLDVWSLARQQRVRRLPVANVRAAAVAPDGKRVAVLEPGGRVALVDLAGRSAGPAMTWSGPTSGGSLTFSPDGRRLAVTHTAFFVSGGPSGSSPSAQIYDVASGRPVGGPLGAGAGISTVAFSPDSTVLATGDERGRVQLHAVASGAVTAELDQDSPVFALAWSPDGTRLAVGKVLAGVDVWTVASGAQQTVPAPAGVARPVFSPDGGQLVVATTAGVTRYDSRHLTALGAPIAVESGYPSLVFAADGRLVVAGSKGPVTVWSDTGVGVLNRLVPGAASYVFPMVGGRVVAVPDDGDSVTLADAATLSPLGPPLTPGAARVHTQSGLPTAFAASYYDGSRIAVVNRDGRLQLFDVATREPIGSAVEVGFSSGYAVFSRDLRQVAVGGQTGQVAVVDLPSGTVRRLPNVLTNWVLGLEYGPDGRLWAGDSGHLVVYDHPDGPHPVAHDLSRRVRAAGASWGMDVSPDGDTVAVATGSTVGFYDARTMVPQGGLIDTGLTDGGWLAYSRDGRSIVVQTGNTARLIDVAGRQPVGPVLALDPASGPVFSHDSKILGTSVAGHGGALMSVDPTVWRQQACAMAGRNLTRSEWARYLPGETPRATCSQFPAPA